MEAVKLVSMEATAAQDPACQLHRKRRGEIAELVFMRKAISLGYGVAKPWGESDHYDFILNRGRNFWRIQVKSVWSQIRYRLRASGSNGKTYTINEIDFLVAYINTEELWYVFPVSALGDRRYLLVVPHSRNSQFEQYRDRWDLLACDGRAVAVTSSP